MLGVITLVILGGLLPSVVHPAALVETKKEGENQKRENVEHQKTPGEVWLENQVSRGVGWNEGQGTQGLLVEVQMKARRWALHGESSSKSEINRLVVWENEKRGGVAL